MELQEDIQGLGETLRGCIDELRDGIDIDGLTDLDEMEEDDEIEGDEDEDDEIVETSEGVSSNAAESK